MVERNLSEGHTLDNAASQKRERQPETTKGKNKGDGADREGQAEKGIEKRTKGAKQAAETQAIVPRLRKYNIRMLVVSVAMLIILCVLLLMKAWEQSRIISDMEVQMEKLTQLAAQQQEQLQKLTEELEAAIQKAEESGEPDGSGQAEQETGTKPSGGSQQDGENSGEEITAAHKVYLTFDDGPSTNTQAILDILDQYEVKATFFVVGKESNSAKELMKKIVEAGHTLAMHSYTHKYSQVYESLESFAADFAKEQEYLYDVTGVVCNVYRFPGGSSNTVSKISMKDCAKYLDTQGVRFFDWNISSGDGGSYLFPAETIAENCTKDISKYSTSVILMHDAAGKSTTVEALPTIIETILEMEDTVILPITDETTPVQHIRWRDSDADETNGTE